MRGAPVVIQQDFMCEYMLEQSNSSLFFSGSSNYHSHSHPPTLHPFLPPILRLTHQVFASVVAPNSQFCPILTKHANCVSINEQSTFCPFPVVCRLWRAARMAPCAKRPVARSTIATPAFLLAVIKKGGRIRALGNTARDIFF